MTDLNLLTKINIEIFICVAFILFVFKYNKERLACMLVDKNITLHVKNLKDKLVCNKVFGLSKTLNS